MKKKIKKFFDNLSFKIGFIIGEVLSDIFFKNIKDIIDAGERLSKEFEKSTIPEIQEIKDYPRLVARIHSTMAMIQMFLSFKIPPPMMLVMTLYEDLEELEKVVMKIKDDEIREKLLTSVRKAKEFADKMIQVCESAHKVTYPRD